MLVALLPLLTVLSVDPPAAGPDDWPGWRGPHGDGVATGAPPVEWSEEQNVRWKVAVPGKGNSSPVVWGDRVFVTTAVPTGAPVAESDGEDDAAPPAGDERGDGGGDDERAGEGRGGFGGGRGGFGGGRGGFGGRGAPPAEHEFVVLALDRADGSVVWKRTARTATPPQGTHRDGSFATATPATDGEVLIASFGSNGLFAYDLAGELLWERDLGDMDVQGSFGEGSSPVLHGDSVFVNWDHEGDSFLVALDRKTGVERWRRAREGGTSWVTPLVVEQGGRAQVVVGTTRTAAYDAKTGEELWSYGGLPGGRGGGVITSPVHYEGLVFVSTGHRGGELRAIDLAAAEGELKAGEALLWSRPGDLPHVPSPLVHDGIVYVLKQNSGILTAFDAGVGEPLYGPVRLEGATNVYASPVVAAGRIYIADRDGAVEVVQAGPEFASLAVNQLDDAFDASPAVAGSELFLRGRQHLYCVAAP